jgi:hypothetical protein
MDFYLFIKSFELISMKIYSQSLNLDDAFYLFIEKNMPKILLNFELKFKSLDGKNKFCLKEKFSEIRQEPLVIKF